MLGCFFGDANQESNIKKIEEYKKDISASIYLGIL